MPEADNIRDRLQNRAILPGQTKPRTIDRGQEQDRKES